MRAPEPRQCWWCRRGMMKARLFVVVGSALAGMVMSASAASAGGWAMSSLDPMSVPVTGQETEVGSTIRQHGVTPVNPDDEGREPVAVAVRSASGDEAVFPARQQGPTGHYDAEVIFPEAGQAHWEIRQGWFGPQDLGAIDVAEARSGVGGAGAADTDGTMADYRWPLAARAAAIVVAVAAAGGVVAVRPPGRSAIVRWRCQACSRPGFPGRARRLRAWLHCEEPWSPRPGRRWAGECVGALV
jgi:hypothetical protein